MITRREFIETGAAAAAILAASAGAALADAPADKATAWLTELCPGAADALCGLTPTPAPGEREAAIQRWSQIWSDPNAAHIVHTRASDDFRAGRIVILDGWVLSQTEHDLLLLRQALAA